MKILGLGLLNKKFCSTDLKIVEGILKKCMVIKVRFRSVEQKIYVQGADLKIVQETYILFNLLMTIVLG